jgi:hypothetical protein
LQLHSVRCPKRWQELNDPQNYSMNNFFSSHNC